MNEQDVKEQEQREQTSDRPAKEEQPEFDAASYWRKETGRDDDPKPKTEYWSSFTDHGEGHEDQPGYGKIPEQYRSDGLSKAALFCGIASLIGLLFGMSLPIGALGILFALLSKDRVFTRQAKAALALCIAGITTFLVMLIISISVLVSTGIWSLMMDRIKTMDPNDPYAVSEIQTEIINELQNRLNGGTAQYDGAAPEYDITNILPDDGSLGTAL